MSRIMKRRIEPWKRKIKYSTIVQEKRTNFPEKRQRTMQNPQEIRDLRKDPLRLGIIGCGNFIIERILPLIGELDTVRIVSIYHRTPNKGKEIASRFDIPQGVSKREDLLENPLVEAVYVASPNFIHEQDLLLCAKYGKPTLCEKPLSISAESIERILVAFQNQNILLFVGQQQRFNPAVEKAKEIIKQGEIGQIRYLCFYYFTPCQPAKGEWRSQKGNGGGALQEIGIHLIDLIHYISGDEISCAQGISFPYGEIDLITFVNGNLSTGAEFSLKCGYSVAYENGFEILGSQGFLVSPHSLRLNPSGSELHLFQSNREKKEFSIPWKNLYLEELKHFAQVIVERKSSCITAELSLCNQKVIDSLYSSLKIV